MRTIWVESSQSTQYWPEFLKQEVEAILNSSNADDFINGKTQKPSEILFVLRSVFVCSYFHAIFLSRWLVNEFLSQIVYIMFNNLTRSKVQNIEKMVEMWDTVYIKFRLKV